MSENFHSYVVANFCVYLGSEFVKRRLTVDFNSALDSVDRGQDLFRDHWDNSLVYGHSINFWRT